VQSLAHFRPYGFVAALVFVKAIAFHLQQKTDSLQRVGGHLDFTPPRRSGRKKNPARRARMKGAVTFGARVRQTAAMISQLNFRAF
jgi:hypothetical protein